MSIVRTVSTRTLIVAALVALSLSGGVAFAVASGGGGPTPQPRALDLALRDALAARQPEGVTARITFTNKLFPSGALLGRAGSALMSGASGRLWLANDGRGRIELQSSAGDVQIVWNASTISIYDASSNTVYRANVPATSKHAGSTPADDSPPALAAIDKTLSELGLRWAISGAKPTSIAGRPAYETSASPRHDGGLLGSIGLAWDALRGTPLRIDVTAQGNTPVLELAVKHISYGAVRQADVDVSAPSDARVVDLGSGSQPEQGSGAHAVTGLTAVKAAAGFPVAAPDSLVGLPRKDVRLVGADTVIVLYGQGLGAIALVERKADKAAGGAQLSALPTVSLDGLTAHELSTQLGTVLQWGAGGTSFVLAGSLPPAAAEAAARAVG